MVKSDLYIGIMSGTSLDGIDIALCEINKEHCKLITFKEYLFPQNLKTYILNIISNSTTLKEIGVLDHRLGSLFADIVLEFMQTYNINHKDINAIALHGQTLWHEPTGEYPFSMQLGDANILVSKTKIKTVADFRRMDIANGGEGAPLTPVFHKFLFSHLGENVAVLNIGGMSNITLLDDKLKGWDSGCGNVLLDYWVHKIKKLSYDKDGEFSKSGELNEELLNIMLEDNYFKKKAPKSTGREYFNSIWLENILNDFKNIKPQNVQRTLLELTAQSISNDLKNKNIKTLIICGGGVKNLFLMQRLKELLSCCVKSSDELGIDSDAVEAMAFAWLAYKRINHEIVELKYVTGAKKDSLLGAIYA